MNINKISFKNYKAFGDQQAEILIKPITLFIGKNSSGKSSILKLISIISTLTEENILSPMILVNRDVSLGGRYEDLFHNNQLSDLSVGIEYENGIKINISYYINKGILYVYKYSIENPSGNKIDETCSPESLIQDAAYADALSFLKLNKHDFVFSTAYIGPLRVQPNRNIQISSDHSIVNVGSHGDNAYSLLLQSYLSESRLLFNNVSSWLGDNMDGQAINFERNSPSSGTYSLYVNHGSAKVNISDVGQGVAQVLPIITQSFIEDKPDIILIEQPALHLHPSAHASVAYRLADMVVKSNQKCIIETHSENILLAIRNLIADKSSALNPDDVIIYFVDSIDEEAFLQEITIDEYGQLSTWPEGVFSESFDLLAQIMSHRKK